MYLLSHYKLMPKCVSSRRALNPDRIKIPYQSATDPLTPVFFSRPQAQLSRSTFALHYVWFLGCPVRENRDHPDVGGDGWGVRQRRAVLPFGLGGVLGVL